MWIKEQGTRLTLQEHDDDDDDDVDDEAGLFFAFLKTGYFTHGSIC